MLYIGLCFCDYEYNHVFQLFLITFLINLNQIYNNQSKESLKELRSFVFVRALAMMDHRGIVSALLSMRDAPVDGRVAIWADITWFHLLHYYIECHSAYIWFRNNPSICICLSYL